MIALPDAANMPRESDSFLRWLGFFFAPYKKTLLFFLILRILRYAILYVLPLVIGLTIKAFESGWAFDHPHELITGVSAYMILYCATLLVIGFFSRESAAQDKMVRAMTMFSIRHINSLPLDWHEAQGSGGKLQRVMTARTGLKGLVDIYKWSVVPFIGASAAILFSVSVIEAPSWFILLYVGFAASFIAGAFYIAKPLPDLHNRHNAVLEKLLSGVYEFVSRQGIRHGALHRNQGAPVRKRRARCLAHCAEDSVPQMGNSEHHCRVLDVHLPCRLHERSVHPHLVDRCICDSVLSCL